MGLLGHIFAPSRLRHSEGKNTFTHFDHPLQLTDVGANSPQDSAFNHCQGLHRYSVGLDTTGSFMGIRGAPETWRDSLRGGRSRDIEQDCRTAPEILGDFLGGGHCRYFRGSASGIDRLNVRCPSIINVRICEEMSCFLLLCGVHPKDLLALLVGRPCPRLCICHKVRGNVAAVELHAFHNLPKGPEIFTSASESGVGPPAHDPAFCPPTQ